MFSQFEESRNLGSSVNLYKFRIGNSVTAIYAFTNAEKAITYDDGLGALTYEPIAIRNGKINSSSTLDKTRVDIKLPDSIEFSKLVLNYPSSMAITVTVYKGHADDPDQQFMIEWTGLILSAKSDPPELTLSGQPITSSMRRSGLRQRYQILCPHLLYDPETCKANKNAAMKVAEVISTNGYQLLLGNQWNTPYPQAKFENGGMVEWTNAGGQKEVRTIRKVSGNVITLASPADTITSGMSVTLYLGCNHQTSDCTNVHKETGTGNPNIVNYGGQPYIPTKNIFGFKSNFY